MGKTGGCGVKSIVLKNLNDPNKFVEYDPSTKQVNMQIDNTKLGSFSFQPEVTLYHANKKVIAEVFTGTVTCPSSSPTLIAPTYENTSLVPGSSGEITMKQFAITDNTFPACGFRDYQVTAVEKGTNTPVFVTNPHANDLTCNVASCLTRRFDTSVERTITVTITGRTFQPAVVSASFDVTMRCDSIQPTYEKSFNIDAAKAKNFRINLPFFGMS